MYIKKEILCPVCMDNKNEILLFSNLGNIDESSLYPKIKLMFCEKCGHIFNYLNNENKRKLISYYKKEYAPSNLNAVDHLGDRPGSSSKYTENRYSQLFELVSQYSEPNHKILDVGCAMGGFLQHLVSKGFNKLYGIDINDTYINEIKGNQFCIKKGSAEKIPFDKQSFDLVILEQVLEHVFYPASVIKEVSRVLKDDGVLVIGVPDASRYSDYYFYDYYWILLREHLHHFDSVHLKMIALDNGFKVEKVQKTEHFVMSNTMIMPNIYVVLRKQGVIQIERDKMREKYELHLLMHQYIEIEEQKVKEKKEYFEKLAQLETPVYIWGIGREFLHLYEVAGLKKCRIVALIDKNPFKQKTQKINNMPVSGEEILTGADENAVLVITAFAHFDSILNIARELKFKGQIVDLRNAGFKKNLLV